VVPEVDGGHLTRQAGIWLSLDGATFRAERLLKKGLEKLGFPWILWPESGLFKGLSGKKDAV
jgi:hypothetical protein